MEKITDRPAEPTAIRTDLGAIFVSLELSRSSWVVTSLLPGGDEKMSRHAVPGGDIAGLLVRFSQLRDNPRLRSTMIQLAWLWLGHQPRSALTRWFRERVERNGGRQRKTAIVALARKLLVALWKYVTSGVVIEGAAMKPQAA